MKSNASVYLELLTAIYNDAVRQCPAGVSDLRDLRTIRSRVECEGISFLTITLPDFCKGVEAALEKGGFDSSWKRSYFRRFKFRKGGPVFLRGFLNQIFDHGAGGEDDTFQISGEASTSAIEGIRQICLAFKKLELDCTPEREQRAADAFVTVEQAFSEFSPSESDLAIFTAVSDVLWPNVLRDFTRAELQPRHGPGATEEHISGNRKYRIGRWHDRLDNFFPLFDWAFVTSAWSSKEIEEVTIVPEDEERPVRVTFVPKTLKAPRVIAIEPLCMQYAQQGIRDHLYKVIESHWITGGHINFSDQSRNQSLAMASSVDGRLATIDLSDASDRVPHGLAMGMFRLVPDLSGAIEACRSRSARLPDGRIIPSLKKFASMGSALCFPVEAMYFYTICVVALLEFHHLPVSFRNIFAVSREIYVYGDDILVPSTTAEFVLDKLRKYNCSVNQNKSFWKGKFRESCGEEVYNGHRVTPVYVRKTIPRTKRDYASLVSWSATGNLLFKKGYFTAAEFLHKTCEGILGIYPEVSERSAGLGRIYRLRTIRPRKRFNRKIQRLEILAWTVKPVYRQDPLDGYAALSKSLLSLGASQPSSDWCNLESFSRGVFTFPKDKRHLERSARHGACTLKLRWVPAP